MKPSQEKHWTFPDLAGRVNEIEYHLLVLLCDLNCAEMHKNYYLPPSILNKKTFLCCKNILEVYTFLKGIKEGQHGVQNAHIAIFRCLPLGTIKDM